jgi:hypothetical protein
MWIYEQISGVLFNPAGQRERALCYAGYERGKNNPKYEYEKGIGPLPHGDWTIAGPPIDTPTHGPYVLRLRPKPGTDLNGRDGFLIHGDSRTHPSTASHGCIVAPRARRARIWNYGDRDLRVVSGLADSR